MSHSNTITWPPQWLPLANEVEALSFGKSINSNVANTVLGELYREIPKQHLLYGIGCRAIAYQPQTNKVFLFETDKSDMPLVSVHFTWQKEDDPRWPAVHVYSSLAEFIERQHPPRKKSWQFWKV